jgi:hypothetical protein
VAGAQQGGGESIPHEGSIVRDNDGFRSSHSGGCHVSTYRTRRSGALGSLQNLSGSRYNPKIIAIRHDAPCVHAIASRAEEATAARSV